MTPQSNDGVSIVRRRDRRADYPVETTASDVMEVLVGDSPLVVVGAGLAGLRACETARRAGFTGDIVLIGEEVHPPYDRPPLSKEFLDDKIDNLVYKDFDALRDDVKVDVRPATRAIGLDVQQQVVHTTDGDVPYGELIIATGSVARQLPGLERDERVVTLRTLDDAHGLRVALSGAPRVVIAGSGFIGSEVASAARSRGLDTTIVEALDAPLVRALGQEVGTRCAQLHRDAGADLRVGRTITGVRRDGDLVHVELEHAEEIECDLLVVGIGAVPATAWVAGSGIQLADDQGIVCDETLAVLDEGGTPIPHVWAAGDVARWHNPLFDRAMRLEHFTTASEQGVAAARNAVGDEPPTPYETVPYLWSDWYGTRLQFAGIPAPEELLVQERTDKNGGTVILYREGDRLIGVFTIGRPDLIMKYRRLIAARASWDEAVEFGGEHVAATNEPTS